MNSMIKKTKQRLMTIFALLTMLFLLLFVVIAYLAVSHSILNDQKEKVIEMISDKSLGHFAHELEEPGEKGMNGKVFALVTTSGEMVEKHGEDVEKIIKGWKPTDLETQERDAGNQDYLIAAKPIRHFGYVYTGINITPQKEVLSRLFAVLLLLTVLFTAAAMGLSFLMAGKAIGPIIRSVERQREFVNDASHELRTPLSILSAGLDILNNEERDKLSDFSRQSVDDMSDEVKRMTSLVNDLLFLARSDSGKLVMEKSEVDLSELVTRTIRSFSSVVKENHLTMTSEIQEGVHFFGDVERLQQLLYLFLDNAVKYNQTNGWIQIGLTATEKKIRITVQDNGIGIDLEDQKKIFDRFYRVDHSRSRTLESNGIGLSIAHFIVQAHGGHIEVESKVGEGTIFTIIFPK